MATRAYFDNIKDEIVKELNGSNKSIKVAVAWFTDSTLFDLLCKKAKKGIRVELLIANHSINHNSSIDYEKLTNYGGRFSFIGHGIENEPIMHHKFCIIDDLVLIHGSYNWTNKAQFNQEDITVDDNMNTVLSYCKKFKKLMAKTNYEGIITENVLFENQIKSSLETIPQEKSSSKSQNGNSIIRTETPYTYPTERYKKENLLLLALKDFITIIFPFITVIILLIVSIPLSRSFNTNDVKSYFVKFIIIIAWILGFGVVGSLAGRGSFLKNYKLFLEFLFGTIRWLFKVKQIICIIIIELAIMIVRKYDIGSIPFTIFFWSFLYVYYFVIPKLSKRKN